VRYERKNSFKRTFKKLQFEKQEKALDAIQALIGFYESGGKTEGLGLKHLREDIWEIRSSLKDRILLSFSNDSITFLIVGNHNEIKNFIKNQ